MFLSHTLRNPYDIAALLLFQLQVRVENTEMELLHESVDVQFDLKFFFKKTFRFIEIISVNKFLLITSCSKNLSSSVFSPGLLPESSNS